MWQPTKKVFIRFHIVGSVATIACGVGIVVIGLVPSFFPGIYRLLVDDRVGIVIPYLLFIALGESIFSIWYFLFRKKDK
jgi:uncharacterized membrane protein